MTNTYQSISIIPLVSLGIFDKLKARLIQWIINMHIVLNIVKNQFFRQMLNWFSPMLTVFVPKSHYTMQTWLIKAYYEKQTVLKGISNNFKSNIYFLFDLWTLNNNIILLTVISHFVNKSYNICIIILALWCIKKFHFGSNFAETILQVIDKYNL